MVAALQLVRWRGELKVLGRNQALKMLLDKAGAAAAPTRRQGQPHITKEGNRRPRTMTVDQKVIDKLQKPIQHRESAAAIGSQQGQ